MNFVKELGMDVWIILLLSVSIGWMIVVCLTVFA
jgi:hypothetical protein